jgi:ABC-type Co2+ transport system permease subunit
LSNRRTFVNMRHTDTRKPSLRSVVFALLLGVGMFVDAGVTAFGGNCASLDVPASISYRTLGTAMRSLCERWGPFVPAAIEAIFAAGVLAFADFLRRERQRAAVSGQPTQ